MPKFIKSPRHRYPARHEENAEADGILIVVANIDGEFYAVEELAPHDGGPLGEGSLEGRQLFVRADGAASISAPGGPHDACV